MNTDISADTLATGLAVSGEFIRGMAKTCEDLSRDNLGIRSYVLMVFSIDGTRPKYYGAALVCSPHLTSPPHHLLTSSPRALWTFVWS